MLTQDGLTSQEDSARLKLIWRDNDIWINRCSGCDRYRRYSNKWNCYKGINKLCRSCANLGSPISDSTQKIISDRSIWLNDNNNWCRRCSSCDNIVEYKGYNSLAHAKSNYYKQCNRCSARNRIVTDSTRVKLRNNVLNRLLNYNTIVAFNSLACEYIDGVNRKFGYDFQHALNGGEVRLCGYMVDGYDRIHNVVFEYDEPHHERSSIKLKDLARTKSLIEAIGCRVIRYSVKYNKLYESMPDSSKSFIF